MPEVSLLLSGEPSSVPTARHFVAETLESWGLAEASWAASQIVSELAGNCALHARTQFCVRLLNEAGVLRLEVQDSSHARVQPRHYSTASTTGRGLRLVEELARRWGVELADDGKTVWVELAAAYDVDGTGGHDRHGVDVDTLLASFDDTGDTGSPTASTLRWAA